MNSLWGKVGKIPNSIIVYCHETYITSKYQNQIHKYNKQKSTISIKLLHLYQNILLKNKDYCDFQK